MTLRDPSVSFDIPAIRPQARIAFTAVCLSVPVWLLSGDAVGPALFLGAAAVAAWMAQDYPHPRIGLCNVMTLSRLALVAVLAARLDEGAGWTEFGIAVAALATDGVDGWAARRAGLVSRFGARLDMEVDSLLALALSLLAVGTLGPWVLMLGVMRYVWLAAGLVLPWLRADLPDRFGRKAVCVVQIAALIVAICPAVPHDVSVIVAAGAAAALLWSFGRDALWLSRNR